MWFEKSSMVPVQIVEPDAGGGRAVAERDQSLRAQIRRERTHCQVSELKKEN